MTKFRAGSFVVIAGLALGGLYIWEQRKQNMNASPELVKSTEEFRQKAEDRLRSPTGWLTVVGLHWLKADDKFPQPIGSDKKNTIVLPPPVPAEFATIELKDKKVLLTVKEATFLTATSEIKPVLVGDNVAEKNKTYTLKDDTTEAPTMVNVGSVTFFAIQRKNGVGLRVRDENAETRKKFSGRTWYEPKNEYVVDAEWVPHSSAKTLMVPDVLGNVNEEKSPGFARFQIAGQTVELHPTQEGDQLFFVFRDQTSGKDTYGAARFLYSDMPVGNRLKLDFNRAVNPPCAFTNFATCPMPPRENILSVAVAAGELTPPGH